jgi:hypothetical protein
MSRTTTGGGLGMTMSQGVLSQVASDHNGIFGLSSATTDQHLLGRGFYSVTTTALPDSIGFNQIVGNSSLFQRPSIISFQSGTV